VYVAWDILLRQGVNARGLGERSGRYFAGSVAKVELDRTVSGFLVEDVFR